MKNNRAKFGLALIIMLYVGFMAYFCMGKPEPNNIVIEQEKTSGQNTNTVKTIGAEFYLSEITDFYEIVIIILFSMIFVILGLGFLYSMHISKSGARDMVDMALKDPSFDEKLNRIISDRFTASKNEGDIADICTELENIGERIDFIEHVITKRSYSPDTDNSLDDKS